MQLAQEVRLNRLHRSFNESQGVPTFLAISLQPYGRNPALPAFTPDHKHLIVPNEATDNVAIVSLEELAIIHLIELPAGSRPWQAKVLPCGDVAYVTNSRFEKTAQSSTREPSSVSVLDLTAGKVIKEIPVGAGPNGVTVDQRGRRGYVANMRSNSISVIDAERHEVVTTVPAGEAPAFTKLSRDLDGKWLLVTNLQDASVMIIDTEQRKAIQTVEVGVPGLCDSYPEWGPGDTTGVAISTSEIAYLTNYRSHSIVVLDLNTLSMTKLRSPIRYPFFVEIDRESDYVVFSSGIEKSFAFLNARTLEWEGVYSADGLANFADVVPDLNLWMTDPCNHRLTAILPNGIQGIASEWSRNMVTKFM